MLRNTAILHWIQAGLPMDEVCRRASQGRLLALSICALIWDIDIMDKGMEHNIP